jgi:hypothetical protein
MITNNHISIALAATAALSLLAAKPAAAEQSGNMIQTETLVMQGKRKELDESQDNPAPAWDRETITVTDRLIFIGKRD